MRHIGHCLICGNPFKATRAWHKYCHRNCKEKDFRKRNGLEASKEKHCKQCGIKFTVIKPGEQHCSSECGTKSARQSRSKFFKKNPGIEKKYYQKTINKIGHRGNLDRFYVRHPDAPKACESCGENRVLDIAHKPEYKRNGQWRSVANTTIEKVWILCPTCHALIDRKGYDPKQLGLK
jgi:predicted nucleic acid-binding Zn ribbon protein